jgi:hypothetical protein
MEHPDYFDALDESYESYDDDVSHDDDGFAYYYDNNGDHVYYCDDEAIVSKFCIDKCIEVAALICNDEEHEYAELHYAIYHKLCTRRDYLKRLRTLTQAEDDYNNQCIVNINKAIDSLDKAYHADR